MCIRDRCNGTAPLEFVGLRSKMYSLLVSREEAKMTAKGIKKSFVKKHVKHSMFLQTLQNKSFTTAEYLSFRSRNHSIHTQRNFKICLSSYDDKRYFVGRRHKFSGTWPPSGDVRHPWLRRSVKQLYIHRLRTDVYNVYFVLIDSIVFFCDVR